jgi:hypothetical protein
MFLREFSELEPDVKKQEFFIQRIEWPLARDPLNGFRTEKPGIYGIASRHRRLDVVVYYSFSDTQIFLESIRLDEDGPIE